MQKELELYEILYLVQPSFTERDTAEKIDYYQEFLTNKGSQVLIKNRGKRQLSYPIQGFSTANYVQMFYLGNGGLVNSVNKEIQRDENVIRNITTKILLPESLENLTETGIQLDFKILSDN